MEEYKLKFYKGKHPRILVSKEFIDSNKLKYCRTEDEIFQRIKDDDIFGYNLEVLVDYLPWSKSKEFYNIEYQEKVEKGDDVPPRIISDIYETAQDFLDYMVFGWMKAMHERGISASCTISKLGNWLWLMGRDDLRRILGDKELYNPYGSPALIKVCEEMGIKVPEDLVEFSKKKCN